MSNRIGRYLIRRASNTVWHRFASSSSGHEASYLHGACSIPLQHKTIGQFLVESAESRPDKDLFIFPHQNIRKTNEAFYQEAYTIASGLLALGLSPGDRVGIWSPNYYEWVLFQFATSLNGMISIRNYNFVQFVAFPRQMRAYVCVNPSYKSSELDYCLKKVGIAALMMSDTYKGKDYYETLFHLIPELAVAKPGGIEDRKYPLLKHVISIGENRKPGCWSVDDIFDADDPASRKILERVKQSIQPDDACNIQFTSGTTGNPKGVTLSHFNIANNAFFTAHRMQVGPDDRICVAPPLYHCFGCVAGSLLSVVQQLSAVFPCPTFQALPCLQAIDAEKCTTVYGTPTMFIDMLHHKDFDQYNYSSISKGVMAGAPCPIELCERVVRDWNMHGFTVVYGSTETSPVTLQGIPDDPIEIKTSTIGRAADHAEVKIVDSNGRIVPRGIKGELWTRGYMTMLGYWNDEAKTDEVIGSDLWYRSGDIAIIDEAGYCKIVGRLKDMIVRGGENVYPTEIEKVIFENPKVADVHVFGVPDSRLGEEICAWVRKEDDSLSEEELKQFCKEHLAHFKIPRYIMFKVQEEFPMTITGKVQKFVMRDMATKELQLEHVRPHMASEADEFKVNQS